MDRWYVVHTHQRSERTALVNLQRQGFHAYLPQYLKPRRHARRVDRVAAPLFPRYLFVNMDLGAARWRAVHSTIGVRHLVCHGELPAPLPAGVIDEIRTREDESGMVRMDWQVPYKKGDVVQITSGALFNQTGLFDCVADDERVIVLLELLGRPVRIRLPAEAICAFA